jgi:hypothetical protein
MHMWGSIILSVLRLLEFLIGEAQKRGWINEGEQRQITKALVEVTRKQEFADAIYAESKAMSDATLDAELRALEGPGEAGGGGGQLLSDLQEDDSAARRRIDNSIQRGEGEVKN